MVDEVSNYLQALSEGVSTDIGTAPAWKSDAIAGSRTPAYGVDGGRTAYGGAGGVRLPSALGIPSIQANNLGRGPLRSTHHHALLLANRGTAMPSTPDQKPLMAISVGREHRLEPIKGLLLRITTRGAVGVMMRLHLGLSGV